jgi:hypothetical protein
MKGLSLTNYSNLDLYHKHYYREGICSSTDLVFNVVLKKVAEQFFFKTLYKLIDGPSSIGVN